MKKNVEIISPPTNLIFVYNEKTRRFVPIPHINALTSNQACYLVKSKFQTHVPKHKISIAAGVFFNLTPQEYKQKLPHKPIKGADFGELSLFVSTNKINDADNQWTPYYYIDSFSGTVEDGSLNIYNPLPVEIGINGVTTLLGSTPQSVSDKDIPLLRQQIHEAYEDAEIYGLKSNLSRNLHINSEERLRRSQQFNLLCEKYKDPLETPKVRNYLLQLVALMQKENIDYNQFDTLLAESIKSISSKQHEIFKTIAKVLFNILCFASIIGIVPFAIKFYHTKSALFFGQEYFFCNSNLENSKGIGHSLTA